MTYGFALGSDSYKYSHGPQLPDDLKYASNYGSARSLNMYKQVLWFGLQSWKRKLMKNPLTMESVEYANRRIVEHCGIFPYEEFKRIVEVHNGLPPVRIEALPEGLIVPVGVPCYQVVSTDPLLPTLGSFLETEILRAAWYQSSVATLSWHIKQDLRKWLEQTCDNPEEELAFRLHDFGGRGASSEESAALGGMSHLINFMGTDTVPALEAATEFYDEWMAGYSIPAMEHFTVTAWGREREAQAYERMIDVYGGEGKKYACVCDAYDQRNSVDNIWGKQLKDKVLAKGGTAVIRLDSGKPIAEVVYAVKSIANSYGFHTNKKGYDVVNPAARIIQGDGVNRTSINGICHALELNKLSIENNGYGMGGALLQEVMRDDLGWAQKASAISADGEHWTGINKSPITAPEKASLKGRQMVVYDATGKMIAVPKGSRPESQNLLRVVYENGVSYNDQTFAQVRANSNLK